MNKIKLNGNKVFFIGIGGSSMSGLAFLLKKAGFEVSGSDMQVSTKVGHLMEYGITVYIGHDSENVKKSNAQTVVYTAAISADNPELVYAKENGLCCMKRSELVGRIMDGYENAVAISGTKGKTTTTSLMATVFAECGLDPSALIGGTSKNFGSNVRIGSDELIVAEACEYQDSFLDFKPTVALILNIELEHTDYFKSMEQLTDSFKRFVMITPDDGVAIGCADDDVTMSVLAECNRKKITYAIEKEADYTAKNITESGDGTLSCDVFRKNEYLCNVKVSLCGRHNAYNVLAVFATAECFGLDANDVAAAMAKYKGTGRRFDFYGSINGASVYDDYAHTPDEYRAVINGALNMKHNRLIGIFQPHTYSRSIDFFDETVEAFEGCDEIIMLDIYAAREKDEGKIHSKDFARAMKEKGMNVQYMPEYEKVADYVEKTAADGDIVLVIGAGHNNRLCEMIVARGVPTVEAHGD